MKFEMIAKPLAVAKEFGVKHKGQSMHKFGSPHVQVWKFFLEGLIEVSKKHATAKETNTMEALEIVEKH